MKWVLLRGTHLNVHHITTFHWSVGCLFINFNNDRAIRWSDPNRELYLKLCRALGVLPDKEASADADVEG